MELLPDIKMHKPYNTLPKIVDPNPELSISNFPVLNIIEERESVEKMTWNL